MTTSLLLPTRYNSMPSKYTDFLASFYDEDEEERVLKYLILVY